MLSRVTEKEIVLETIAEQLEGFVTLAGGCDSASPPPVPGIGYPIRFRCNAPVTVNLDEANARDCTRTGRTSCIR